MGSQLTTLRGFINGSPRLECKRTLMDQFVYGPIPFYWLSLIFWLVCRGMREVSGWVIFGLGCLALEIDSTSTLTRFVGASTLIECVYCFAQFILILLLFCLSICFCWRLERWLISSLQNKVTKLEWPHHWFYLHSDRFEAFYLAYSIYVCSHWEVLHATPS